MIKKITMGLLLSGAGILGAGAVDLNGFGTQMGGDYNGLNYVSYGKIQVNYNPDEIGDEWNWSAERLFGVNFNSNSTTKEVNSGWVYDGFIYAARYNGQGYKNYNEIIKISADGKLIDTYNLGNGNYGYFMKAVLNPDDDMLYVWASDYTTVYFGKISPDKIGDFNNSFEPVKNSTYDYENFPLGFCQKDDKFYFITKELKLKEMSLEGEITNEWKLTGVDNFTPGEWLYYNDHSGLAMIYSEEIGRFLWSSPYGLNGTTGQSRVYAFDIPKIASPTIKNEVVCLKEAQGPTGNPGSYWTSFMKHSEVKEVEAGTPKAPASVVITPSEYAGKYDITWSPVTECVEEGKALDTPNLTYKVLLNDKEVAAATTLTTVTVEIEATTTPVEYTAHVWAVCPNATSEEASSNTITVQLTGVDAVVDGAAAQAIYTVMGTKVNATSTADLPAGIYIVDGRKVIVK